MFIWIFYEFDEGNCLRALLFTLTNLKVSHTHQQDTFHFNFILLHKFYTPISVTNTHPVFSSWIMQPVIRKVDRLSFSSHSNIRPINAWTTFEHRLIQYLDPHCISNTLFYVNCLFVYVCLCNWWYNLFAVLVCSGHLQVFQLFKFDQIIWIDTK